MIVCGTKNRTVPLGGALAGTEPKEQTNKQRTGGGQREKEREREREDQQKGDKHLLFPSSRSSFVIFFLIYIYSFRFLYKLDRSLPLSVCWFCFPLLQRIGLVWFGFVLFCFFPRYKFNHRHASGWNASMEKRKGGIVLVLKRIQLSLLLCFFFFFF